MSAETFSLLKITNRTTKFLKVTEVPQLDNKRNYFSIVYEICAHDDILSVSVFFSPYIVAKLRLSKDF